MTENEEWFEVARRNYVAMRDDPAWSQDQMDEAEEEYDEAKRMLWLSRLPRTSPAVAGPMATVPTGERGHTNPSTTAQESNDQDQPFSSARLTVRKTD